MKSAESARSHAADSAAVADRFASCATVPCPTGGHGHRHDRGMARPEYFVALEAGDGGMIRRCHPHDPSWQNWPVIEHAIIDNIVPDFPLINKSFNLSYSGHDL